MENIIFGLMVVIMISAGMLTCIYEAGGSAKPSVKEPLDAEQNNRQDE